MRSIVCDTGPLNYLIQIECIDVVGTLFKPVLLPDSCHRELFDMMAPEPVRQWASELPEWVNIPCCERSSGGPYRGLSLADSDVLAIAAETNSVLLMDDLAGRRYAHSVGLPVVGTLGLLEIAARKKLTSLKESLSRLQQTNIRIAEELYLQILERNPGLP